MDNYTVRLEIYSTFGEVFYVDVTASEVCIPRSGYAPEVDDEMVENWIEDHLTNVESWDVDQYPQ